MKASDFTSKLKEIATSEKTVYAWGMFGSQITKSVVSGKAGQYPAWYTKTRINNAFAPHYGKNPPYWGFDCVGLVKGVLWGWEANPAKVNGGAVYASQGVPDISADTMIARCTDVSADFSSPSVGEFVWMKGHCGVYVGDGKVVESTPKWKNGVQITALTARKWCKHGKLPYLEYEEVSDTVMLEMSVLKRGTVGAQVKTIQRLLLSMGYDLGRYGADGDFGSKTDAAVRSYQKSNGLTVDGTVGKNTWGKILGVK